MKGELAALRKEVRSLTNILLADREEMKAAQLQLGSLSVSPELQYPIRSNLYSENECIGID